MAIGRVAGAIIGAVIGVAWLFVGGAESLLMTGGGIVIAGAATAYLAGLKPTLRYGSVTSAIIILHPGADPLMRTWHYAAAIGLGAAVGALTSAFVFPWKARFGVREQLGKAVQRCGDLLQRCLNGVIGREAGELDPVHRDVRRSLEDARAAAAPSRNERFRRAPDELDPVAFIRAVERLWHAIIIIDRTDSSALPEGPRRELTPHLDAVTRECCAYLSHLGEAIASGNRPNAPAVMQQQLEAMQGALANIRDREPMKALPAREAERVFTLAFAFDQLNQNIAELASRLGAPLTSDQSAPEEALGRNELESGCSTSCRKGPRPAEIGEQ